jgi:hypothetical protein
MSRARPTTKILNLLADVARRTPGSRPVPVQEGSKWKRPVSIVLLAQEAIVFLGDHGDTGERAAYSDIAAAKIVEDVDQKFAIELRFRDAQAPRATLFLQDTLFFMIAFAALTHGGIPCQFSFTPSRLRALGAQ